MRKLMRWKGVLLVAVLFMGMVPETGLAAGPQVDDPTIPDVIIESPQNTECVPWDKDKSRPENETVVCPWFPSMVKLANGDLYLANYESISHSHSGVIVARRSTDDGLTWSSPTVIVDDTVDDREPNLLVLRNGNMLMSYYDYVPSRINRRRVYVRMSTDNGATWGPPAIPPTLAYDNIRGQAAASGEPVELNNGDILLPIYVIRSHDGNLGKWGTHVLRSRDGGHTWLKEDERVVMWDGVGGTTDYTEPALADLGNGHIMMVARTARPVGDPNADIAKISHSYDYGETWTTPVDEPSLKPHGPHILKLKGGSHFLTYGDRSNVWGQGRPVVGRMYLDTKGWSYTESKLIYNTSGVFFDMAYPTSVELDDGRIFTVYYDRWRGILAGTYTRPTPYKLDLWKMFLNGKATYQTDLTHTASSRPMMQPWAPLDGNISYWNGATANAAAPPAKYWQVTFDQAYPVTDIGVVLKPGYKESATVSVSTYGTGDWQTVKTYTMKQTDDYDWTALRPEQDVKQVRVDITDTSGNGDAMFNDLAIKVAPTTFERSRSLKMDLWQMMRTGRAAIGGSMNYLDPTTANPGLNPLGPIDGKANYLYAATASCSPTCAGTWQVSLDQAYAVNKVGLMLKPGYSESAVVETSADGVAWNAVASLTMANTAAVQYFTFPETSAKFVRVTVTAVSSGWPLLAEFELFTATPMIQP
ncbi:exo-alpha-sialidase [Paenibacillus sp. MBLB4367]|uniref:exo-alpha-sialidase n=1 Tax=Paenibacillus sp. MBLB4367 TaxID=3384767 RepID=UPI003907F44D